MTAQFLLTAGLLGAWLYAWTQSAVATRAKIALYAVIALGIYFIWFPDDTTVIANALGIGRGADLLLYLWIALSFGVILNLHLKLKANLNLLTELARHVAIAQPYHLPSSNTSGIQAGDKGGGRSGHP